MGGRGQFGSARRLASGRWQASYWWEGVRHVAPATFATKALAATWLSTVYADLARGGLGLIDPRAGQVSFGRYCQSWLALLRSDLRPRTRELYEGLLHCHLVPALGHLGSEVCHPAWSEHGSPTSASRKARGGRRRPAVTDCCGRS